MGNKIRVGIHDGAIQKMVYEKVVLPTITYNMDTTTNMTNQEMKIKLYKVKFCRKYTIYLYQLQTGVLIELVMTQLIILRSLNVPRTIF